MRIRQILLAMKQLFIAMILVAVGSFIVFSTAKGNGASTGTNESPTNSPANASAPGSGNGNLKTSDVDVKPATGTPSRQDNPDAMPLPARPERTMSIEVRKVYAPESDVQRWPLRNQRYRFINAQTFESKYQLWKEFLSNPLTDSRFAASRSAVCITSARYYGTMSETGELSGWGEWKVVVNRQMQRVPTERGSLQSPDSNNGSGETSEKIRDGSGVGELKVELFISSELKILLTDFVFYDASAENLPEPKIESPSADSSPLQADSETHYPVEMDVVSATYPNGQTVLHIPSEGTIRFRWKAKRLEFNDYQIQSLGSVESLWVIDVPLSQKLSLRSDNSDPSKPLCASVTKQKNEKSDSWRYSIRWSELETAIVHIGPSDEKENRFDRFYQQQTTYNLSSYHLNTQCRIVFEPDSRSGLPLEIPFVAVHAPHIIWEASLDGQPVDIHYTESGFSVSLKGCQTDNPRPVLLITSSCPLSDVQDETQEAKDENAPQASKTCKLLLPRIDLQSGRWQSGTAIIYTLQAPLSVETSKSSVINYKRENGRHFQTVVEQESPDADIVMVVEPFKERFYSQAQTVVQWDGSQASFISTIELQAEEGRLYSLTASLPEGLTIDQASSEEQPDMIEDWDVDSDTANPSQRTLTIYLRKSLSPGRKLVLKIRSHAIADWNKPIELNRFMPIAFDRFESQTQTLKVKVSLNERFVVGGRVLYSPEQEAWTADDSMPPELPNGIECTPYKLSSRKTGRIDAYEFSIDLKKWGNCPASLEPVQSDYAVNAKTTVWVDKNSMEEKIELTFSGERSLLSQFHFSYGRPSDAAIEWQGLLVWSNNRYKINVEPVEGNVFSIEIPKNVSSPFTVYLTRKIDWNQQCAFNALGSNNCSRLTSTVSVCSRAPQLFDIKTYGMKCNNGVNEDNVNLTIGTYEYDVKNEPQDAHNHSDGLPLNADASAAPRIEISICHDSHSDVSIWAWNQLVEERHFASGSVLTSAQWTIENRFPPQDAVPFSDTPNTRLQITLPTNSTDGSAFKTFLTGVRIDNESVSGDSIIQESENVYTILLPPQKKLFVLTVQWSCYNRQLNNYCSFEPQKPILNISVLQSSWKLYYPTSYRRLNSYLSSDPAVDGLFERFFGPLLRRDSTAIMKIVSQIWDDDQVNNQDQDAKNKGAGSREQEMANNSSPSNLKSDSNSAFPAPNILSGYAAWNCCQFDGHDAPKIIRIIRSEVSECIRWTFFIISISVILTLYFKRANLNRLVNLKNEKQDEENSSRSSWGFRRWICIFGGVCCILCQALPWFLSLAFSGAFLGTVVCLVVLAVPLKGEKSNNSEESTSVSKSSSAGSFTSRITLSASRFFIFVFLLALMQPVMGQSPVLPPPPSPGFAEPGAVIRKDFEIFIPLDQKNRPKNEYYVPQELLDLMQTGENLSPEHSWIVCRTQYFGKLFQKARQTESGLWKCAIEIETLVPNASVDLSASLKETAFATSNISVSRGRILKTSTPKTEEEKTDDSNSETLNWSWDKLDIQTVLQWNPQNERWGLRLAQPGRYLIEMEFRPTIVTIGGKNEISFPILECLNSTFELMVPENITGLEFPGSYDGVTELTPNLEIPDPSIPTQPGMKLKRVQLGSSKKLTVCWNAGGFLSDGPVYDVDTITWWSVSPDSVEVKIKYNVKVSSGSITSLEIKTDDRLALLNESADDWRETDYTSDSSEEKEQETQDGSNKSENQGERNAELKMTHPAIDSSSKLNSVVLQSGVHYSVISSPDKPNVITVAFDSPVTSQTSFELHFIMKDAVGVGRLQFPATTIESSRSGQRLLAFTFDSSLQYDCASESLTPMSAQSFLEQWRGFQKQNAPSSGSDNAAADRRNAGDSIPDNYAETETAATQPSFPPSLQTTSALPTVAYDLNLSRRKTDSSGVVDNVVMNVQRTKAVSEGTVESFVLAEWDRLLWQIEWTIDISRGECSGYSAALPESMCKPENHLSIASAFVKASENGFDRSYPVSARIEGNELKLFWGTPVEGKCQLVVTGEIRPDFESENADSRKIDFDFPKINTLNVTQYKLALGRTDGCVINTRFDRPTPKTVVWTQAELSVESPFPGRNQRLVETWQSTINDTSKMPCAFYVEVQKNEVSAEIDASVKLVQDSSSALVINGRVKVNHGILDEFLLDIPENCGAPSSSKTTLKCQLDDLSITQRRFILRPLYPFVSDSEFELTIPLKKPQSGSWKLEKQDSAIWSVVYTPNLNPANGQVAGAKNDDASLSAQTPKTSADNADLSNPVIKAFGLKMFVKPMSETQYCASAEFACAVSGADSIRVRLPKDSKTLSVQIEQRSVHWIEKSADEMLIPISTENDPVDVRIVYTSSFNRSLYSEQMRFEPLTIEQTQQPEILWIVLPWKNLSHAAPGSVRATSFINKQIWLINDLNSQFEFLQQSGEKVSSAALERLSGKLDEIASRLNQYESRGEKTKTRMGSSSWIPNPDQFRLQNLSIMETSAIRLAMQNVLRLRKAINEKRGANERKEGYGEKSKSVPVNNSFIQNTELFGLQSTSTPPLVGTSDPGTAFVLTYSLPPTDAPSVSIWQILSMLLIPVIIWLAFFPPQSFLPWRPAFVLGCLSIIWLLCFNPYGVSIILFAAAMFDALNKLRQRSKPDIIPLRVR